MAVLSASTSTRRIAKSLSSSLIRSRLYVYVTRRITFYPLVPFSKCLQCPVQAVNELEGRVFNGNSIAPSFYDAERFDRGLYY